MMIIITVAHLMFVNRKAEAEMLAVAYKIDELEDAVLKPYMY